MSPQAAPMPSIQGEAMELFTRVPPLPINSSRGGGSRGSPGGSHAGPAATVAFSTRVSGRRPSTSGTDRGISGGLMISQSGGGVAGPPPDITNDNANVVERPRIVRPGSRGEDGDDRRNGGAQEQGCASAENQDTNETKSKLLGGYLRDHLLANITCNEPAKELVKRSFRHLHRGQGHVLTFDEFKEGLSNTFGALIPLQLIQATFDIFDTEPRTWQLDFDEFCHWLDTGERVLNSHGVMKKPVKTNSAPPAEGAPPKARKPRSNDTSGEFNSSIKDCNGVSMSMEQADRAQLKAHLMKHRKKIHKPGGLTEAQKSIVDHILMDKIKARKKVTGMLPHLHEESEIRDAFSRMDHNGDGVVDLTDFLMWEERMQEGRGNTDFFALQEEDHLEQIKLARSKASNLLVPDDYDGSTYHAKLSREIAQKKRAAKDAERLTSGRHADNAKVGDSRDELAQVLRDKILSQVKGGSLEMLRAFRHFRPAAAGRRLFMDYTEFRESIKQKGLGLGEEDIKTLFGYFDVDGSGEIDFSEFRRFLQGGIQKTGLDMGVNRHEEKTVAARSRVAALEKATALNPSLAGDARSDQLLKAKVLLRITGGQTEVLRALRGFGTDGGKSSSEMDYPAFSNAINKSGFNLSEPETKQIFNEFRLAGPSGEEKNGVPTGTMSAQAFREWLLESHTSTGLDVGELRATVVSSFESDRRHLLRAFRNVTRKKGSTITAADFRDALSSFGLFDDKPGIDRLFKLYDWRNNGSVSFQELMEIITGSDSPPRRLTTSQRIRRLEDERRLPEEAIKKVENTIRNGLWDKHLDNAKACFRALTGGQGGKMGLEGLRVAVRIARVRGEAASSQVLGWSLQEFIQFYRPADCRAAMALARVRDGGGQTEEDLKRAALIAEGNRARTKLVQQVRRLSKALKAADKGTPVRSGRVSRKTFAKALAKEGGLGRVGEAELTRLLVRHGCSEQGGTYVNYPVFVASFTAAVMSADPSSAVAAVAAANAAAAAAAAASVAKKSSETFSGMVAGATPTKHEKENHEHIRSRSNPQLALLPPRPRTAAAGAAGGTGERKSEVNTSPGKKRESAPLGDHGRQPQKAKADTSSPSRDGIANAVVGRAQTADGPRRRKVETDSSDTKVPEPSRQGYFKRFTASGGDIDSTSPMKVSKSAPALPDLVGQRPEVPKTTPIHRVMKKDVAKSATNLRKAFKQCENPYRRGVVSVEQFQAVCLKNGVTVDKEDIDFLLRLHRHKNGGSKYAIPPKWTRAPSPGASRDTAKEGVRYDEFLRTCLSATSTEVPIVTTIS
ncbi:conserved unknown protein [Ectocarpus siliculosus]|uniref:EF-hand domain-containing protein n=1 Tax=Ectocarpus siliculosus TaxID=2880 RepID=D7G7F4_ECTSI|nr:conserved unknown protein [Ectocarpus siliculosus]|eukprot:CBJ27696.1 conserved unknown protein [Ectocarpus siliculosus]